MKQPRPTLAFLVIALIAALQCSQAKSASDGSFHIENVRAKIGRYNHIADQYLESANRRRDSSGNDGTFTNIEYKERECEVLADLLALGDNIVTDAVQGDPGIGSNDRGMLELYAFSLKNYVKAAEDLLSRDDFSWKYLWNLNCSGKYNSYHFFALSEPVPYRINISADGASLNIIGDIQPELYERLAEELQGNKDVKLIKVASRGGAIGAAMKIGRLIRSLELDTILASECTSACTLVFIAGTRRIVPVPYYSLGFHRITQFDKDVDDGHPDYRAIAKYADDMIGTGDQVVQYWQSGSGEYFFRPDKRSLCRVRIVTDVEGVSCQLNGCRCSRTELGSLINIFYVFLSSFLNIAPHE